jgi:hypothetical protein
MRVMSTWEGRLPADAVHGGRRWSGPGRLALALTCLAAVAWTWSAADPAAAGDPDTAIAPGTGNRGQALWIAAELALLIGGAALACTWIGRRRQGLGDTTGDGATTGDTADGSPTGDDTAGRVGGSDPDGSAARDVVIDLPGTSGAGATSGDDRTTGPDSGPPGQTSRIRL